VLPAALGTAGTVKADSATILEETGSSENTPQDRWAQQQAGADASQHAQQQGDASAGAGSMALTSGGVVSAAAAAAAAMERSAAATTTAPRSQVFPQYFELKQAVKSGTVQPEGTAAAGQSTAAGQVDAKQQYERGAEGADAEDAVLVDEVLGPDGPHLQAGGVDLDNAEEAGAEPWDPPQHHIEYHL
jgi:hypothetical protein